MKKILVLLLSCASTFPLFSIFQELSLKAQIQKEAADIERMQRTMEYEAEQENGDWNPTYWASIINNKISDVECLKGALPHPRYQERIALESQIGSHIAKLSRLLSRFIDETSTKISALMDDVLAYEQHPYNLLERNELIQRTDDAIIRYNSLSAVCEDRRLLGIRAHLEAIREIFENTQIATVAASAA